MCRRLEALRENVQGAASVLMELRAAEGGMTNARRLGRLSDNDVLLLKEALSNQRVGLERLNAVQRTDARDLGIIKEKLATTA